MTFLTQGTYVDIGGIELKELVDVNYTKTGQDKYTLIIEKLAEKEDLAICGFIGHDVKVVFKHRVDQFSVYDTYKLEAIMPRAEIGDVIYLTLYLTK